MGKKLNADQRRGRRAGELRVFIQQYARKAYPGRDPNDRQYNHDLKREISRMDPRALDRLLRDDDHE